MGQLADKIKQQYPQYAGLDDAALEAKVVAKYPQYQQYVTKSPTVGGFVSNIGKSALKTAGDVVKGAVNVLNPNMDENTIANIGKLGIDTVKLLGGDTDEMNRAKQLTDFYKIRYGKDLTKTLYEDPIGVLMDISTVIGGGGAALKAVGVSGKGASLAKTASMIDPIQATGRSVGTVSNNIRNTFKDSIKGKSIGDRMIEASDNILTSGIGNPAKQVEIAKKTGLTMPQYIHKYNLYDRSPEASQQISSDILSAYDSLARENGSSIKIGSIVKDINSKIDQLSEGPGLYSESVQAQIAELSKRRDQLLEFAGANGDQTPLTIPTRNVVDFRRTIDADIPQSQFNLDAKGSGTAQGTKSFRDSLRTHINATDPNLERLGLDYGASKGYTKILEKSQERANNRQLLNFSNLGASGVGAVLSGVPGAIGGAVMEHVSKQPLMIKTISNTLKSSGEKINDALKKPQESKLKIQPTLPQGNQSYSTDYTPKNTFRKAIDTVKQTKQAVKPYVNIQTLYGTSVVDRLLDPNSNKKKKLPVSNFNGGY